MLALSSPVHPRLVLCAGQPFVNRSAESRLTEIDNELITLDGELIDDARVTTALGGFDNLWDALAPREQARVLELLVERVKYDGKNGNVSLTFHPCGIKSLTEELANQSGHLLQRLAHVADKWRHPQQPENRPQSQPVGRSEVAQLTNTPGGIRTHDLWFRKPSLYPAELRVQCELMIARPHHSPGTPTFLSG